MHLPSQKSLKINSLSQFIRPHILFSSNNKTINDAYYKKAWHEQYYEKNTIIEDNTEARLFYCIQKKSLVLDNLLKIRDLNKHKEDKIKFIVDSGKRCMIILVYYIL